MKFSIVKRSAITLIVLFAATAAFAQQNGEAAPDTPELSSLSGSWWSYFEGPRDEVEPRANVFIGGLGEQIAELQPQDQEIAQSVLDAVEAEALAEIDAATEETRNAPPPDPATMMTDVWANGGSEWRN